MKTFYKLLAIAFIVGTIIFYSEYKHNQLKFSSMSVDYKLLQEIIKLKQDIKILKANRWY